MTTTNLTKLEVCKDASAMIAGPELADVDNPTTTNEQTFSRLYDLTVKGLLARHPWAFVNIIKQCSKDADQPAQGGFASSFRIPAATLAGPFAVYAEADFTGPVHDYLHLGDYIYADYERIDALVRVEPSPGIWPQYFRLLATVALAARCAKPIADNTELQTELRIEAFGDAHGSGEGGLFQAAKKADAQTKPTRSIFQNGNPLTTARLGGFGNASRFRT